MNKPIRCTTHFHACDCREYEFEQLKKENQEMREALGEAIKILNDGCLVYDQHVPSGSSSFRSDAQWFIDTNSSKLSNSSKEGV